jgi:hypothetical protein
MEHLGAIREERRARPSEVQTTDVHFAEECEELGGMLPFVPENALGFCEEIAIGKLYERRDGKHVFCISRQFSAALVTTT